MIAKEIVDLLILSFLDLVDLRLPTQFHLFAKIVQFLLVLLLDLSRLTKEVIAQPRHVRFIGLEEEEEEDWRGRRGAIDGPSSGFARLLVELVLDLSSGLSTRVSLSTCRSPSHCVLLERLSVRRASLLSAQRCCSVARRVNVSLFVCRPRRGVNEDGRECVLGLL